MSVMIRYWKLFPNPNVEYSRKRNFAEKIAFLLQISNWNLSWINSCKCFKWWKVLPVQNVDLIWSAEQCSAVPYLLCFWKQAEKAGTASCGGLTELYSSGSGWALVRSKGRQGGWETAHLKISGTGNDVCGESWDMEVFCIFLLLNVNPLLV